MEVASEYGNTRHCRRSTTLLRMLVFSVVCFLAHPFRPAGVKPAKAVRHGELSATTSVLDGDSEAFKRITLARRATKHFERKQVPEDVLKQVLALVLRAPSSFNMQPYQCIVVTTDEGKRRLSKGMLGENRKRVLDAGASVIFASDLNSMKNVGKLTALLEEEGWPPKFIRDVPLFTSIFSTGHNRFLRLPMTAVKKIVFGVVRRLGKGMPTIAGAETWAFKNTMLAAQEFLLASTAYGLASCPMEGFDMRRLRKQFNIPLRYSVPIVVSIGYPLVTRPELKSLRFAPEDVFHREDFGTPMEGIPRL